MAAVVLVFAALLVPVGPAQAASTILCTGYTACETGGYPHAGYAAARNTSYWNMYTGTNCTNYVAFRLVSTNGMPNKRPASGVGNARDWGTTMASVTNATPTVGAVAWWGKTGNHVAYIERVVSSSEIWVSESNWSGAFDWRKITKSGGGWPDGFIHFADQAIINKTAPAISGTVRVGGPVKASGGSWTPTGNTYAYQWLADGAPIAGATGKEFTPTPTQLGQGLAVSVAATRPGYGGAAALSPAITVAPGGLTATSKPSIGGSLRFGGTLTASPGVWSPAVTSFSYQWMLDGADLAGATSVTFKPRAADVGKTVSVRVRAAKGGYSAVFATSEPTAALGAAPVSVTSSPTIAGTPTVGTPLAATPGTWSRTELSFSYQWLVGGVAVSGATAATFTPRSVDLDRPVTVEVTARRTGYATTTSRSTSTAAVGRGTLTMRTRPAVSGTPRVGSRLTAAAGAWSPAASYTYQWYRGTRPIAGATDRTFVPAHRDRGGALRVKVTARRDGFVAGSVLSRPTTQVAAGRIRLTAPPTITGQAVVGTKLAVRPGSYGTARPSARHQWLRDGVPIAGATSTTYRLGTRDLGRRLSVRVTLKATGYTAHTTTTARLPRVKTAARMSASAAKPAAGTVTFTIRVTAKGAVPNGSVTVRRGTSVVGTAKIANGRATVTLRRQPTGPQTYRLGYRGSSRIAAATIDKAVTVR